LTYVLFAYNTANNETTKYSPFYLLHGYHPQSIFDYKFINTDTSPDILSKFKILTNVRDKLPEIINEKVLKNKKHYDLHKTLVNFDPGEKVSTYQYK